MKILHLTDALDESDSARQLRLLAPALAGGATAEICCLGPDSPGSDRLRQAGIAVHALGWARRFDPGALWSLHKLLRDADADVIHVWSLPALRALAMVAAGLLPRVVLSAALPTTDKLAWWDRALLQRVRCRAPLGIVASENPLLALRADQPPRIACAGPLERESGFRQAIWAFDFLLAAYPDARLEIAGTGSQRSSLQALAHGMRNAANVRFLGAAADAVLRDADIVWVPSLADHGRQIGLEAMALGKPVVASNVPCLRELIRDTETGFLIRPGDVVALARRTYALLEDREMRACVGRAAREDVQRRFSVGEAVARWREVYGEMAA